MDKKDAYLSYLESKIIRADKSGFEVHEDELHPQLKPFQKFCVRRALRAGRFALFHDCGLGKTFQQLEWANHVVSHTGKPVLTLCPLAVAQQTIEEGQKWGIEVVHFWECLSLTPENSELELQDLAAQIVIVNYEQLKNIPDWFIQELGGVVLDESSILKNFTGKYRKLLTQKLKNVPFKLACTATPAPNDPNELGNHSEFLNVLDATDMRQKWFVRDEGMNNYRLKKHGVDDFYSWVSSWSVMASKPSDLGFEDKGYDLPDLKFHEKQIQAEKREGALFNNTAVTATSFNKELKLTIIPRLDAVAEIVNNSDEPFIVWVNQNEEEKRICEIIPDAVPVSGSMKPELKEKRLLGFAKGEFRVLVTKKKIAQFGLNYQHCSNQVFAALDFSFEGLYQAIRRSYRFGQENQVNIYLITTDTMQNVIRSIERKRMQFEQMQAKMNKKMNSAKHELLMFNNRREIKTENYHIVNNDNIPEMWNIPDNSQYFSVFSPPFSNLFTYSNFWQDSGNCADHEQFYEGSRFMLKELFRIMKPGRIVAVHSKDLAVYKNSSGHSGLYNFTGKYHDLMEEVGFKYHSKITIWTDPVLEMQRTKTQRLLYKQLRKDSSLSGVGLPEYVTLFRKWDGLTDENHVPIQNKNKENFGLDIWQKWASPVWGTELRTDEIEILKETFSDYISIIGEKGLLENVKPEWLLNSWFDIRRTDVLNGKLGTDLGDEKHIAPLQLSVIRRLIAMWTNEGETVFEPYMGIGSAGYEAVQLNRKYYGIELKPSYFDAGHRNLEKAVKSTYQLSIF